jgi:hypothetical protein
MWLGNAKQDSSRIGSTSRLDLPKFKQRFVERIVSHPDITPLHEGKYLRRDAEKAAAHYWVNTHKEGLTPEEYADEDMSYWGKYAHIGRQSAGLQNLVNIKIGCRRMAQHRFGLNP